MVSAVNFIYIIDIYKVQLISFTHYLSITFNHLLGYYRICNFPIVQNITFYFLKFNQ